MYQDDLLIAAQVVITVVVIMVVRLLLLNIYSKQLDKETKVSANERRLGPLEIFFEETHKNGGPFICCTLIRLQSSTSLSYDIVYKTLTLLARRHPLLRARIIDRNDEGKYGKYFVVNDKEDLIVPLKTEELDASKFLRVIEDQIHEGFENNLLWRVIYLKEKQNIPEGLFENSLVFVTHHAITDGKSAITLAGQFCKNLNAISRGKFERIRDIQSLPMADELLKLIEHEIGWSWWQKVLLFPLFMGVLLKGFQLFIKIKPMKNIFLDSFPDECLDDRERLGTTRVVYEEMNETETECFVKACKANKCTVQGAVAVAWHLATKHLMKNSKSSNTNDSFQWYCPVSVRRFCKPMLPDDYLGCYVSSVIDKFKVPRTNTSEEFWELARRCTRVIHNQIERKQHLGLLRVYNFLDLAKFVPEYKLSTRDPTVHGLTNMGCFDWRDKDDVFKTVQSFLATGNHHYGMIFQNHISTINGRFNVATTYFNTVVKNSTAIKLVKLAFQTIKDAGIPK